MIQHRAARVAITASATRRQGSDGVVECARAFAFRLKLSRFGTSDQRAFRRQLDTATNRLRLLLPKLEIPLDSITAKQIRRKVPELPRWPGVKYVDPRTSAAYQAAALFIAREHGVARVHLDAYWWGARN